MFSHRSLLCTVLGREPHSILTWSGDFFFSWQFNRLCLSLNAYGGLGGPRSRKAALDLDWGQPQAREQVRPLVGEAVDRGQRGLEPQRPRSAPASPLQARMD